MQRNLIVLHRGLSAFQRLGGGVLALGKERLEALILLAGGRQCGAVRSGITRQCKKRRGLKHPAERFDHRGLRDAFQHRGLQSDESLRAQVKVHDRLTVRAMLHPGFGHDGLVASRLGSSSFVHPQIATGHCGEHGRENDECGEEGDAPG